MQKVPHGLLQELLGDLAGKKAEMRKADPEGKERI